MLTCFFCDELARSDIELRAGLTCKLPVLSRDRVSRERRWDALSSKRVKNSNPPLGEAGSACFEAPLRGAPQHEVDF